MTVACIDEHGRFLALRESWNELAKDRSVFLRHEWFDAAWQWRRHDDQARLAILCVHRNDRLVGILPLIARIERHGGPVRRRLLEFLTVPDNQLCDLIAAEDEQPSVADKLADELAANCSSWDEMRLAYLPDQSIVHRELIPALERHGISVVTTSGGGNAFVTLEGNWSDYYSSRSRSLKKACNLAANRLGKAGAVSVEWLTSGIAMDAVDSFRDAAIDVSAKSWKRTTGNSLDRPGPKAFFRRLVELALQEGWLSLWLLRLDGKPVATECQLIFAGRVHALRSDFIEEFDDLSPGTYLNRHLLEHLFDRGLQCYMMGPGDNPYKKRWSEKAEPLYRIGAYSPTARGRLAAFWDLTAKPAFRYLRAMTTKSREADSR